MDISWPGPRTLAIAVDEASQVGQARRAAQALAEAAGFDEADSGRVALVATELATNVIKHGRSGHLHLGGLAGTGARGVELCAVDRGPGFDLADCRIDGYSTRGTNGIGLGAIERQAQVFETYSDERGAIVLARFYPRNATNADRPFGVRCVPMKGESVAGDGWHASWSEAQLSLAVVDGLGHGPAAHDAAQAGIGAIARDPSSDPATAIARMHAAMTGTRGGAAAVARYDGQSGRLTYAGIGNIAASLIDLAGSRGLASHAGIVGAQFRKTQAFDFPDSRNKLLIMHSDGLQSRWTLQAYPGLVQRHPSIIAAVLLRDFDRGRDDTTVVVARLGE